MKIISYKETEQYLILRIQEGNEQYQAMIDNYPQIKDFKNYGFKTIEDMMIEVKKGILFFDKVEKKEHKIYKNDYNFNTIRINELKKIDLKFELIADFIPDNLTFNNYGEFYYFIKDINIKDFYSLKTNYKTKIKVDKTFLNVIDITKLYLNNYNNYICLNFLADLMSVEILERNIIDYQERIIINNLKTDLKEVLNDVSYEFIKNYSNVLEKIYNISLLHLIPITNLKNESVFYFSNRYLAKKTNRSEASINYIINCFVALGFIKKIDNKDLSKNFLNKARDYKENDLFFDVSFYSIQELNISKIKEIEENISIMIAKNSSFSKITKKEIKRLFGKERSEEVFPNVSISKKTINKRLKTRTEIKTDDIISDILGGIQ